MAQMLSSQLYPQRTEAISNCLLSDLVSMLLNSVLDVVCLDRVFLKMSFQVSQSASVCKHLKRKHLISLFQYSV